jgi:hypothetical protein
MIHVPRFRFKQLEPNFSLIDTRELQYVSMTGSGKGEVTVIYDSIITYKSVDSAQSRPKATLCHENSDKTKRR